MHKLLLPRRRPGAGRWPRGCGRSPAAGRRSGGCGYRGRNRVPHPGPLDMHGEGKVARRVCEQPSRQRQLPIGPTIAGLGGVTAAFGEQRRARLEIGGGAGLPQLDTSDRDPEPAMVVRGNAEQ